MSIVDDYCMEKDGAVKIPEEYLKMSYEEISAECARLEKIVKERTSVKKTKPATKTRFMDLGERT